MAGPASAQDNQPEAKAPAPAPKTATTSAAPAATTTAAAPTTATTTAPPSDASATPAEEAATDAQAPPTEGEAGAEPAAEAAPPALEADTPPPTEAEAATDESEVKDDDASWLDLHPDEETAEPVRKMPYYTAMVLAEGTAKYGAYTVARVGTFEDETVEPDSLRTGQLGGQVTVGIMPNGSAFAMAGRLRGGSYVGERVPGGYVAAEMLFGANFARNAQGSTFTYLLGGFGVEFLPGDNQDLLSLSATGGTVVNGIDFGAGINLAANDEVAIALIGMHIGWGRLF